MVFTYPAVLVGLLAVAIPVLIHFLQFSKPRVVYYTRFALLRKSDARSKTTRTLRDILILLSRIIAISALVVAFAQPFIPDRNTDVNAGAATVAFLVDNSFSMFETAGNEVPFDQAVKMAVDIERNIPAHTPRYFFDSKVEYKDKKTLNPTAFKERLSRHTEPLSGVPFSKSLEKVMDMLLERHPSHRKILFVFSDFQYFDAKVFENYQDQNFQIYLLPTSVPAKTNVFVDSVWLESLMLRPGQVNNLMVRVKNSGYEVQRNVQVKLLLEGSLNGSQTIELAPNAYRDLSFDLMLLDRNSLKGTIELEESGMTFDNTYYFSIHVPKAIQVGIIESSEGFVHKALKSESFFEIEARPAHKADAIFLAESDILIIENVGSLSTQLMAMLRNYLSEGKKILFIPNVPGGQQNGEKASLDGIFDELLEPLGTAPPNLSPTLYALSPFDLNNPFFKGMFETLDKNTLYPYAKPCFRAKKAGVTLLNNKAGQEAMVAFHYGKGLIYSFMIPFDKNYTDLHLNAMFVPLVYTILFRDAMALFQVAYRPGQGRIELKEGSDAGGKSLYSIQTPNGTKFIPEQTFQNQKWVAKMPASISKSGYYHIIKEGTPDTLTLAINYAKDESLLAFFEPDALKRILSPYANVKVFDKQDMDAFKALVKTENFDTPLWRWFVALALLAIIFEIFLVTFLTPATKNAA